MKRTKSQYARLMELDRRIRDGGYPNCLSFAGEWGVSAKTVQRDIDFLRDQCAAPIAYDRERRGFHYEGKSWWLPSVALGEGELLAVLLASRAAEQYRGSPVARHLDRVFTKLADLLPGKLTVSPELLYTRFSFTAPPAKPIDAAVWTTVVRGLLHQQTLRIVYRTFDAQRTTPGKESQVEPYHIASLQGEWYLFGVHHGYTDVRQFSMARIEKATLTGARFVMPAGFDPKSMLSTTFARYAGDGKVYTVRLLFGKEIAGWITEREWHPGQKLKHRKTGEIELEFPAKGLYEVQRWVLSWGHYVTVLAPDDLAQAVEKEVQLMRHRDT